MASPRRLLIYSKLLAFLSGAAFPHLSRAPNRDMSQFCDHGSLMVPITGQNEPICRHLILNSLPDC